MCRIQSYFSYIYLHLPYISRGREIAQSLASLSIKRPIRVRARHEPLVIERRNSITVLLTCSHQCRQLVQKKPSMCYYVCNNACKRSLAICRKSRALCPVSRLLSVPIWPACAKTWTLIWLIPYISHTVMAHLLTCICPAYQVPNWKLFVENSLNNVEQTSIYN